MGLADLNSVEVKLPLVVVAVAAELLVEMLYQAAPLMHLVDCMAVVVVVQTTMYLVVVLALQEQSESSGPEPHVRSHQLVQVIYNGSIIYQGSRQSTN
jgi:hypothetical protein